MNTKEEDRSTSNSENSQQPSAAVRPPSEQFQFIEYFEYFPMCWQFITAQKKLESFPLNLRAIVRRNKHFLLDCKWTKSKICYGARGKEEKRNYGNVWKLQSEKLIESLRMDTFITLLYIRINKVDFSHRYDWFNRISIQYGRI